MSPIAVEFLCVIARWLLATIGSYVVAHHVMTGAEADRFSSAILSHLAMWAMPLSGLAWGLWAKVRAKRKVDALLSPAILPGWEFRPPPPSDPPKAA